MIIEDKKQISEKEVEDSLAFAKAALGVAGHEITDPYILDLLKQSVQGEITDEEYTELTLSHIRKKYE